MVTLKTLQGLHCETAPCEAHATFGRSLSFVLFSAIVCVYV